MDTLMGIITSPFMLIAIAIILVAVVLLLLLKRLEERDKALSQPPDGTGKPSAAICGAWATRWPG